jgi:hypothetical protein
MPRREYPIPVVEGELENATRYLAVYFGERWGQGAPVSDDEAKYIAKGVLSAARSNEPRTVE